MRGSRLIACFGARHAGFLSEYDLFTDEELENDPIYYRDFFRPRSFGWQATTRRSPANRRYGSSSV